MAKIRLGNRYRETLNGIEGVAMSIEKHLTGCDRVTIRTMDKEGKECSLTYDTTRLKLIPNSSVQEHTPIKSKVKLGQIYQDRSTGIIGHAIIILERLGLPHALVSLEYLDSKTGQPIYAHVDEPLLDSYAEIQKAAQKVKDEAASDKKKRGPGPSPFMHGMSISHGHSRPPQL